MTTIQVEQKCSELVEQANAGLAKLRNLRDELQQIEPEVKVARGKYDATIDLGEKEQADAALDSIKAVRQREKEIQSDITALKSVVGEIRAVYECLRQEAYAVRDKANEKLAAAKAESESAEQLVSRVSGILARANYLARAIAVPLKEDI